MILAPLQKVPKNVGDLGKLIVAKGFKKLPKVKKIANSGHTALEAIKANRSTCGRVLDCCAGHKYSSFCDL